MLLTKMDLLNYQYLDKMNNNIGILCYEGDALRSDPRMQSMSAFISAHRTGPPPSSPSKRKYGGEQLNDLAEPDSEHVAKMSRLLAAQIGKTVHGQHRRDPRDRSRSPMERPPVMGLNSAHMYGHMPGFVVEQPLALTKNSMDTPRAVAVSPAMSPVERQQNRPSVITCASASNRNCNLSHCHMSHGSCSSSYRKPSNSPADTPCDPVIEEHFRRSLGNSYRESDLPSSVSITGSVDEHFAKALGEAWLQIKAKGSASSPSEALNQDRSPSMVS
ncbi:transcription cofactor vestigial-like protein 4 isoform X2 [Scleropages formosus]|uniref:Vestigial like family member 4 n=1 Tax=Scleropages formosus TaxID=113540 RepID=A0A8D0CJA3_SCLFO|nr:transcription cofactor vestigial-like protein 4 isoform X2 [Scleropages formosus]